LGKGKRADAYLEVRKRGEGIYFLNETSACAYFAYTCDDMNHRHLGPGYHFFNFIDKMCIYNVHELV
jgi:hypothetical protein